MNELMTLEQLTVRLQETGKRLYHHKHPFHLLMHEGKLTKDQLRAWALNRYYYQMIIPQKDAMILARSDDMSFRRAWRKRIEDHDGREGDRGGLEKWISLAEATGASREEVISQRWVLPSVRFAVDAYLQFVSQRTHLEAVASSLTELFSADLIAVRMKHLKELYPWIEPGLAYFEARLSQAPEDVTFALDYIYKTARTRGEQEACVRALETKCRILWAQLDAIYYAYVDPKLPPPGYERD
jgi:pyrroloquinoline-quinone synthase